MSKKKQIEQTNEEQVETPVVCNSVAYTMVSNGDKYDLIELKFNLKEKKLGKVLVLSTDDRFQIEEELMLKIEDMLYDV